PMCRHSSSQRPRSSSTPPRAASFFNSNRPALRLRVPRRLSGRVTVWQPPFVPSTGFCQQLLVHHDFSGPAASGDSRGQATGSRAGRAPGMRASGAWGGNNTSSGKAGGKGALAKGNFSLTLGTTLSILVGQAGAEPSHQYGGAGGGGGSFVFINSVWTQLLVAAGGGGGATWSFDDAGTALECYMFALHPRSSRPVRLNGTTATESSSGRQSFDHGGANVLLATTFLRNGGGSGGVNEDQAGGGGGSYCSGAGCSSVTGGSVNSANPHGLVTKFNRPRTAAEATTAAALPVAMDGLRIRWSPHPGSPSWLAKLNTGYNQRARQGFVYWFTGRPKPTQSVGTAPERSTCSTVSAWRQEVKRKLENISMKTKKTFLSYQ
uniref:receptor protein-tyrosine kinase n=1 Tax=Macrostomum lignano TaxID=282301 RepID=A0A1I8JS35_9PLAT